jgi:hypothetical protein
MNARAASRRFLWNSLWVGRVEWTAFVEAAPDLRWEAERPWSHMEVDLG